MMTSQDPHRWTKGLVRRVVLPVSILVAIVVPSFSILQSASLPDLNYVLCQMHLVKTSEPPADIVFFGSSRTGAAIDAERVASELEGELETAEKVVLTLGSELDRNLAYRTYAKYRGIPKVLAIEMSFEHRSELADEQNSLVRPTGRTVTLFETDIYQDLLASLRSDGNASLSETYVESTYLSPPGYFFDRLGVGADLALRSPTDAMSPTEECVWTFEPRRGRWVVGDTQPYNDAKGKVPSAKEQRRWTRAAESWRRFDLEDPLTQAEVMMLNDMVDSAYADGVETVVLYYLPSFEAPAAMIDIEGLQERISNAVIFDAREVLRDEARPLLQLQYYDAFHLNRFAAYEVSSAIAQFTDKLVP